MKKIFINVIAIVSLLFAQNFTGAKYYINPGHGGYDSNDRNIPETGFWESESNLHKSLYLRDILQGWGATIVMSRVTNTSADDKALSTIVAEANAANVDHMHSIHSNAFNETTNYTLVLYQGTDSNPTYAGAKEMSDIMAPKIYQVNRTTNAYSRGDMSFYGTTTPYLGVFKGLNMPGTLSEGSFHDYIPESWRLMNMLYKKHEAIAIARSFIQKFNKTAFPLGVVAGIIRTKDSTSNHKNASGNDIYKPLNDCKVTLTGGNINKVVYTGNKNNGFYLFDSLPAGTYKVVVVKQNFIKDSANVTVTANTSTMKDFFLTLDKSIPAVLKSYSPNIAANDSVYITTKIVVSFSRGIDKQSFESAFQITPNVTGTFSWSIDQTTVTFTPSQLLQPKTKYTVLIPSSVKSIYNVNLPQDYTFSFNTNSKSKFVFKGGYPENNQTDVPHFLQVQLRFDDEILTSSVSGQFLFTDITGKTTNPKNVKYYKDSNGDGMMVFEPQSALQPGMSYKITMKENIKSINGLPLGEVVERYFTVSTDTIQQGTVLDGFENISNWKQPSQSSLSVNTTSTFEASNERKFSGSYSGKLNYKLNSSNSVCAIEAINKPNLGNSNYAGLLVWGDLSNNLFQLITGDGSTVLLSEVINWAGWKYVKFKNTSKNDVLLNSIVVKPNSNILQGELYIDNLQKDVLVSNEKFEIIAKDRDFILYQNYPNPFNPATTIRFNMPKTGNVMIKVYNSIGQEVATLFNGKMEAGMQQIQFEANNLTSGVYYYTVKTDYGIKTAKMMLVK
ncbi:MAG TPA: Ig-like domain-containing protein [Ignavibacteriales bacterium]|nr:Ig-like domain-containing protein [Ignavibacteriales bacterium]